MATLIPFVFGLTSVIGGVGTNASYVVKHVMARSTSAMNSPHLCRDVGAVGSNRRRT